MVSQSQSSSVRTRRPMRVSARAHARVPNGICVEMKTIWMQRRCGAMLVAEATGGAICCGSALGESTTITEAVQVRRVRQSATVSVRRDDRRRALDGGVLLHPCARDAR